MSLKACVKTLVTVLNILRTEACGIMRITAVMPSIDLVDFSVCDKEYRSPQV